MKIRRVDVYARTYGLVGGEYVWATGLVLKSLDTTIVKLTTDEGLVGFGETCPQGAAYLPAFALGARAGAREIAPALLGLDPRDLRVINTRMDAALLGHPYAKTPFDEACWDILGKASSQSVSTLLGGRYRDEYPTYFAISQDRPEVMAQQAAARYDEGFRQIQLKVGGDPDEDIARTRAVRAALDARVTVMGDANTGWSVRSAARFVRGVEGLDVYVEQPCKTYEECCPKHARTPFPPEDVWYHNWQGGGGYGDPLERKADAVLRDVQAGLVSPESARDVYGVALQGVVLDPAATAARRQALREARVPGARAPAGQPAGAQGALRYGEYLELDPELDRMWCGRCGHTLGRYEDDLRQAATRVVVPLTAAGPVRGEEYDRGRFQLELSCCPGCGVQLEADVVQKGGPRPWFRLTRPGEGSAP